MPSDFIRVRVAADASLRCAMDHRSGAIGTSLFTRSKMSSNCPTDASLFQCIVSVMPRAAAHRTIW